MSETEDMHKKLPLGLKVAAIYLMISGAVGLLWPILGLGPHHSEFEMQSLSYKLGAYSRQILFDVLFVISGVGLLLRKSWARKMALVLLVLGTLYAANSFAWGFARGRPHLSLYLVSFGIAAVWNGLWFYLLHRKQSAEALS
jgi:hypothetical protein